jgi:hypothetical protein
MSKGGSRRPAGISAAVERVPLEHGGDMADVLGLNTCIGPHRACTTAVSW